MNIPDWLKRNASTILTCIGAGGFIFTVIDAVRQTPKAMKRIEGEKLTKKEIVKRAAPCYIRSAITGVASLGCFFGANVLDRHQISELNASLLGAQSFIGACRARTKDIFGEGGLKAVDKAVDRDDDTPWEEKKTFYIELGGVGIPFEATENEILQDFYWFNRKFAEEGFVTEYDLAGMLGILKHMPPKDPDKAPFGWDQYIDKVCYDSQWVDYIETPVTDDDGFTRIVITLPVEPHSLNEAVWGI